MIPSPPIRVVAAIICREGRYLAAQRPEHKQLGLKWEFPGGKVEPGETPKNALIREISEELGCKILINGALPVFIHSYGDFSIEMMPFLATLAEDSSEPHPHEHIDIKWLTINDFYIIDLAEADLPIVAWLKTHQ